MTLRTHMARLLNVVALVTILGSFLLHAGVAEAKGAEPKRQLEFGWQPIPGAKSYEIKFDRVVNGEESGEPTVVTSTKNAWKGRLPAGSYHMRIRAVDQRGVPGRWGKPTPLTLKLPEVMPLTPAQDREVKTKAPDEAKVAFTWQPLGEDVAYEIEILGENKKTISKERVEDAKAELALPVSAKYLWRVKAVSKDGVEGDAWAEPRTFQVRGGPLPTPEVTHEFEPETRKIEWSESPGAKSYAVKLAVREKGKKGWKTLLDEAAFTQRELAVEEGWPDGKYRLKVKAAAPLREPSKPMTYNFARRTDIEASKTAKDEGDSGKEKDKKAKPKPKPHTIQVSYGYVPMLRRTRVVSSTVDSFFNDLVVNSHQIGLGYRFSTPRHSLGLTLGAHLARSELFANSDKSESDLSGQQAVKLVNNDFYLEGRYGLALSIFDFEVFGGPSRRDVHLLAADSPSTFGATKASITEFEAGGGLGLRLGTSKLLASYTMSKLLNSTESSLTAFKHSEILLSLRRSLIGDFAWLSLFFEYDKNAFSFVYEELDETYQLSETRTLLGVAVSCVF